jgi:trehalose 6-phosphate phosphatase
MPEPTTAAGRAGLAALLEDPSAALVGLDFDGTLAPIVADPAQARALPAAAPALRRLGERIGTVAIITGRPAAVAVEYAGLDRLPPVDGLLVLGHYGAERWNAASGELTSPPQHPGLVPARREVDDLELPAGASIEDKGRSFAVHTRRASDPAGASARLRPVLEDIAGRHDLHVEPGRLVLELRPPGIDKGAALHALVQERDAQTVVFIGDDLGDLAAFRTVARLRDEGRAGLAVCSGSAEVPELAEHTDLVVGGPAGVVAFLSAIADTLTTPGNSR